MSSRRRWLWGLAALLGLTGVAVGAFLLWALTPLGPEQAALDALESDAAVGMTITDAGYEFAPRVGTPRTCVIIYPGGRVDARSYAPLGHELASNGVLAVIVKMPLSLAVFDPDAAAAVKPEYPDIENWVLAGHSLGGAMAASALADDPSLANGLLLLAAYAPAGSDLTAQPIEVTNMTAELDGVLDQENWKAGKALLPSSAQFVSIAGGNHAQFGDYGPQPGDNEATASPEQQLSATLEAAIQLVVRVEKE